MTASLIPLSGRLPPQFSSANGSSQSVDFARSLCAERWTAPRRNPARPSLALPGRTADAGDLRSALYRCFTEGFDTADLKEAKALLDGLD